MSELSWTERYEFAQRALLATEDVTNGAVYPVWLDAKRFWYQRTSNEGVEFRLVDAEEGSRRTLVTLAALTVAISKQLNVEIDRKKFFVSKPVFDLDRQFFGFEAFGKSFQYDLATAELRETEKVSDFLWLASPDKKAAAFVRDHNLWVRDMETGAETELTTDGSEFNAYATPPSAMRIVSTLMGGIIPDALWSPDGKWILTLQTDDRHVPKLQLAEYAPAVGVRPLVHANKTSLPGDAKPTEFRMIAVEVATGRQVEARYPRLAAVRMNSTPFASGLAWWGADSRTAYFVDIERGERHAHVVAQDVETGACHVVFTEESESYVEVSVIVYSTALIVPLPKSNELIWYSERTGRGHLYLYDLTTGECVNAITKGDWQVRNVLRVDEERREVFFTAGGITEDNTPYLSKPCLAKLTGEVRILSDAPGEHLVWRPNDMGLVTLRMQGIDPNLVSGISPGGDYFVETVSDVDRLSVTSLRHIGGQELLTLEEAEETLPAGWQVPERVRCLAADGVTETYGILYKPLGYDPARKYPLIDCIYGGPQISYVPRGHFADGLGGSSLEGAHLASLGAFVLVLDGRGTAERDRSFRIASHKSVHTASNLEDHIAAIQQLADLYPIDLHRVGLTGFSGGGYMTAMGAMRFGDFFSVSVAGGGNYDQALFWHSWGERYHGEFDADHYAVQAVKTYASGLQGKLLLVHGLMDSGCHPAALFQLVQALVEADKDPDLVILPRAAHDWTGYGLRRRYDYFVTHLFGETAPSMPSFRHSFDAIKHRMAYNLAPPESGT